MPEVEDAVQVRVIEALSIGSVEDAQAALQRLLQVTEASFERRAQLQQALESRIVIEQAKGVLMERFGLTIEDAFDVLRRGARRNRIKLHDLAREVVGSRITPQPIEDVLLEREGQR